MSNAKFCRKCGVPLLLQEATDESSCPECELFAKMPDELSRRKYLMGKPFMDMKHMDEDERIRLIATQLRALPGAKIGVMVDCNRAHQGKGDRYIDKIRMLVPNVTVNSRTKGPVNGAETISFTLARAMKDEAYWQEVALRKEADSLRKLIDGIPDDPFAKPMMKERLAEIEEELKRTHNATSTPSEGLPKG